MSTPPSLLTPQEAAQVLGVHVITVRRWTKSGKLEEVRTPGGHRRIPRLAIERLLQAQATAELREADILPDHPRHSPPSPADTSWAHHALVHTRTQIQHQGDTAWMQRYDDAARQQNREMGRRLLGLLLQHVAGGTDEAALWQEVRTLARQYAQEMQARGLSLTEATRATLFFRDVLSESTAYYPHLASTDGTRQVDLMRRVNAFLNEIQLMITETYERGALDRT